MAPLSELQLSTSPETDLYSPEHFMKRPLHQVPPKKSVSFSDFSEMFYIPHAKDLSPEEFEATYMTEQDFERIKQENDDTLRIMRRGKYPGTTKRYFRGLEVLLPKRRTERREQIDSVVAMILKGQSEGRGSLHKRWIHYYCSLTAPAVAVAHTMGAWDAEALQAELQADLEAQQRRQVWL